MLTTLCRTLAWITRSSRSLQHTVTFGVLVACLGAAPAARTHLDQRPAGPADPADPPGRYPGDQREVWYVAGHHRTGGHQGPADDHALGVPVAGPLDLAAGVRGPRVHVVGEHHRGADEHAVLQPGRLIDQGIVLQ